MIKIIKTLIIWFVVSALSVPAMAYVTGTPVPTDSRIKTFVYNANDVFRVLTHYGYQMNIEFSDDEEIDTVSVGDRSGWQITPTENRIFVRAMEDKAHTNMTVITDKRTYQFDLYSAQPGQQGWDELVYVVRFFYPPANANQFAARPQAQPMMASYPQPPAMSMPAPSMMPQLPPPPPMAMSPPSLPPLAPPPMVMQQSPAMMPAPAMPAPPMAMAAPMQAPSMFAPQMMPPMGQPLYSPDLPPVSPPPMAMPNVMSRPATPVPPVNVARKPYGMIVPPHMAVAPPPRMPHPRAPFVANQMTKDAQTLARQYPKGSYRNSRLAPRTSPSLNSVVDPKRSSQYSSSYTTSPMGLPLPSTAPGGYLQF